MLATYENRKTVYDTLRRQSETARWVRGRLVGMPADEPHFSLALADGRALAGSFYIVQTQDGILHRALYLHPGELLRFDEVRLVAEAFCFGPSDRWLLDISSVRGQGCLMLAEPIVTHEKTQTSADDAL